MKRKMSREEIMAACGEYLARRGQHVRPKGASAYTLLNRDDGVIDYIEFDVEDGPPRETRLSVKIRSVGAP